MQNETISQLDRNFEILSAGLAIFLAFMFFYFVSVGVLYFYLALVYPQRNRKAPDQDDSSLKRTERQAKPAENFIEFKKATYQAVFDCPREHCDTHSLSASTEYASKHREMSRKMGKFVKKGFKVEKDQISKKNSAEEAGNQTENAPKTAQNDQNSMKKSAENSEKDVQVPENPREEAPKRFTAVVRNVDENLSDAPSWNGKEPAALAYFGPGAENGEYESKTITNSSSPNFTMKTARMSSPRQSTATAPSSTLLNTSKLNSLALNQQQEVLKTAQTSSPADPAEPPKVANGNGDQPQTRAPTRPQTGPLKPKMYPILRPL